MRIKYAEGQTLLTLSRAVIVIIACLCVGGVYGLVTGLFSSATSARDTVAEMLNNGEDESSVAGEPVVLYFSESGSAGGQTSTYQMFYITGSEGAYGLTDAGGNRLLDDVYQGIILLPHAYVLKQDGRWRFYDRDTLEPLSDYSWDDASVEVTDNGRFVANLVAVRDGDLYGAVDMRGGVVIEPAYEEFQMSSLKAIWPLIKVKQNGKYGFINTAGQNIVSITYDYAVLDSVLVYADENDAEGTETPIIYVIRDGDWGAMYRNSDGSSSDVDWSVDPTAEVLSAYEQGI